MSSTETAKITAEAQVETASIQGFAEVETKWWFVSVMIPIFALPYAAWTWKAIVWDKLIEHGQTTTDSLGNATSPLAVGYSIILGGLFLHSLVK